MKNKYTSQPSRPLAKWSYTIAAGTMVALYKTDDPEETSEEYQTEKTVVYTSDDIDEMLDMTIVFKVPENDRGVKYLQVARLMTHARKIL